MGEFAMAKKTYNEKLHSPGDLPKIEDLSDKPEAVKRMGGSKMLIAAPMQYNEVMTKVPEGKVITTDRVRAHLAAKFGADVTCALTAGIFTNICANASAERDDDKIPYWRTLKAKGELNEKYPDGIDGQKLMLETEGHTVIQKGKRYFVQDYENALFDINELD
jgi:alkylated DNA nucleotide flippase Atl1